jgi:hypothetical protein
VNLAHLYPHNSFRGCEIPWNLLLLNLAGHGIDEKTAFDIIGAARRLIEKVKFTVVNKTDYK